jgi:hypothetical protein
MLPNEGGGSCSFDRAIVATAERSNRTKGAKFFIFESPLHHNRKKTVVTDHDEYGGVEIADVNSPSHT